MKVYKKGNAPADGVYIGRGSVWGNPYVIGKHGDRQMVLTQFALYAKRRLEQEPEWLAPLQEKNLVCFCAPLPCHGNIIQEILREKV